MAILLQALGWSLLASAAAMTSDPAYYSQEPLHAPRRPAPYFQQLQQQLLYPVRAAASFAYPPRRNALSVGDTLSVGGRPYDTDYTGRQLRYRADIPGYNNNRRVASYEAPGTRGIASYPGIDERQQQRGYYQPEGYRKVQSYPQSYGSADDDGSKYVMIGGQRGFGGGRNARPYHEEQSQGYLGDSSLI